MSLAPSHQVAVFGRELQGRAKRSDRAWNDRDAVDRVGVFEQFRHQGVPALVKRDAALFVVVHHASAALEAELHPVNRLFEIRLFHLRRPPAPGRQRRFVHDVREVRADHPHGALGDDFQTNRGIALDPPRVDSENGQSALHRRALHHDRAVEAARPEQRGVEHLWTVRRADNDHAPTSVEPVHLDEQLIERLLPLIVAAGKRGDASSCLADRVDSSMKMMHGARCFA